MDPNLIPGRRYEITHRREGQRLWRNSILDYLGDNHRGELAFSARPVAGTVHLNRSQIAKAVEVDGDTPIRINKVVRD